VLPTDFKSLNLLLLLTMGMSLLPASGHGQTAIPDMVAAVRFQGPIDFCGEAVPLESASVRERFEKEMLLSLWDRDQAVLWLKRSTRFLPVIEALLAEAGVPDDLKYVALAESALRPHAGSPKGAIGFWQFLADTGRKYGLTINARIDERRNLRASTQAAIRFFQKLYADFGSWSLAAAAFNMGEEGLKAEILAQDQKDFYRLYLPLETQRYLFRILSAKLILSHPRRYGFEMTAGDFYPPLDTDPIDLMCWDETSLTVVAQAAGTDFKTIKDLNPEIRGHYLAAGRYRLALPAGAAEGFQARFDEGYAAWQALQKERIYVVQEGDNLSLIAERFQVPLPALLIWNRLDMRHPIHPGDRLIIHPAGEETP
jgi:hypothetical protein